MLQLALNRLLLIIKILSSNVLLTDHWDSLQLWHCAQPLLSYWGCKWEPCQPLPLPSAAVMVSPLCPPLWEVERSIKLGSPDYQKKWYFWSWWKMQHLGQQKFYYSIITKKVVLTLPFKPPSSDTVYGITTSRGEAYWIVFQYSKDSCQHKSLAEDVCVATGQAKGKFSTSMSNVSLNVWLHPQ